MARLVETKNTLPRTVPLTVEATALFRQALDHPVRPIDTRTSPASIALGTEYITRLTLMPSISPGA